MPPRAGAPYNFSSVMSFAIPASLFKIVQEELVSSCYVRAGSADALMATSFNHYSCKITFTIPPSTIAQEELVSSGYMRAGSADATMAAKAKSKVKKVCKGILSFCVLLTFSFVLFQACIQL